MVHVQAAHMINIYELGTDTTNNNHNINNNNNNNNNNTSNNKNKANSNSNVEHSISKPIESLGDKIGMESVADCPEEDAITDSYAFNVSFCPNKITPSCFVLFWIRIRKLIHSIVSIK